MDKENLDPDFAYYDRGKSHISKFYKQTPGVCTNTRMELQSILRNTEENSTTEPQTSKSSRTTINFSSSSTGASVSKKPRPSCYQYWGASSDILRGAQESSSCGGFVTDEALEIGAGAALGAFGATDLGHVVGEEVLGGIWWWSV